MKTLSKMASVAFALSLATGTAVALAPSAGAATANSGESKIGIVEIGTLTANRKN